MITTNGKVYIKRYLAAQVPTIAQSIAFGLGGASESAADSTLQFEIGRGDVTITSYDFSADKVIFKAVLPEDLSGKIYEVGLFSQTENSLAGNFSSKLIASFDSGTEVWVDSSSGGAAVYTLATTSSTFPRLGGDSLKAAPAASQTQGYVLNDLNIDLSGNSGADVFKFAYNVSGVVPDSVTIRFRTDASNYYYFTQNTPSAGYHIDTLLKGNALVQGTPTWSSITGIEVVVVAAAGGSAVVDFDGIRIEDTDTVNPDYVLVSREVLSTPYEKVEGKTQEIEFSLVVSV